MKNYGFVVAHSYNILKGYIDAETKEQAIKMIEKGEYDDTIEELSADEKTEGYKLIYVWKIQ